jgi:hypothetical protein
MYVLAIRNYCKVGGIHTCALSAVFTFEYLNKEEWKEFQLVACFAACMDLRHKQEIMWKSYVWPCFHDNSILHEPVVLRDIGNIWKISWSSKIETLWQPLGLWAFASHTHKAYSMALLRAQSKIPEPDKWSCSCYVCPRFIEPLTQGPCSALLLVLVYKLSKTGCLIAPIYASYIHWYGGMHDCNIKALAHMYARIHLSYIWICALHMKICKLCMLTYERMDVDVLVCIWI